MFLLVLLATVLFELVKIWFWYGFLLEALSTHLVPKILIHPSILSLLLFYLIYYMCIGLQNLLQSMLPIRYRCFVYLSLYWLGSAWAWVIILHFACVGSANTVQRTTPQNYVVWCMLSYTGLTWCGLGLELNNTVWYTTYRPSITIHCTSSNKCFKTCLAWLGLG